VLNVPTPVRVFLYALATDMRKSFSGLHGLIVETLQQDPLCGVSRLREPDSTRNKKTAEHPAARRRLFEV